MENLIFDRIKQYQNKQMPESERLAFENQIKTDPAFANEVAIWLAIYHGIQGNGDERLQAELLEVGKNLLQQETTTPSMTARVSPENLKNRFSVPRWVYAAAALLLLLVIALPLYQRLNKTESTYASADAIYSEHFKQPSVEGVRDNAVNNWRVAYEQANYAEAIADLEALLNDPDNRRPSKTNLYIGLSYLGLQQPQQAIEAFKKVGQDSEEWGDAQWYSAMAWLKLGDTTKAKALLQSIADETGHIWSGEPHQILKQLK